MKTEKLNKKYTPSELADAFVFRNTLTDKQKEEARKQLAEARKKVKEKTTDTQKLYARILQLRYQMEDYAKSSTYDEKQNFASFLRTYIKLNYKINKEFADDIHINETELSQILNKHRDPSENIIIRLELHSNNVIPAVSWFKLLEKEKLYELETDTSLREQEEKYVKRRLAFDF